MFGADGGVCESVVGEGAEEMLESGGWSRREGGGKAV